MDGYLNSPFAQISAPEPPAQTPPGKMQHPAGRPPVSGDSWSAQQSSLALRFYRLGLPGVAELILSSPKLDTSALMKDVALLEAGYTPSMVSPLSKDAHALNPHGGGVSTPPETPSVGILLLIRMFEQVLIIRLFLCDRLQLDPGSRNQIGSLHIRPSLLPILSNQISTFRSSSDASRKWSTAL